MCRMTRSILASAAAASLSAAAWAGPVPVSFQGVGTQGHSVKVHLANGYTLGNGLTSANVWAGEMRFSVDGANVITFCTELGQFAGGGMFEHAPLASAPTSLGGMGAAKAQAIYALYNANNGGVFSVKAHAAAFQAMIWEITYDYTGDASSLNIAGPSTGNLRIDNVDIVFFDKLRSDVAQSLNTFASVHALVHEYLQDQIVAVPMPSAASLGFVGGLVLAARRRRN